MKLAGSIPNKQGFSHLNQTNFPSASALLGDGPVTISIFTQNVHKLELGSGSMPLATLGYLLMEILYLEASGPILEVDGSLSHPYI